MPKLIFKDKRHGDEDILDLSDREMMESELKDFPKLVKLLDKYSFAEALEKFAASLNPVDFTVELRWGKNESKEAPKWLKDAIKAAQDAQEEASEPS